MEQLLTVNLLHLIQPCNFCKVCPLHEHTHLGLTSQIVLVVLDEGQGKVSYFDTQIKGLQPYFCPQDEPGHSQQLNSPLHNTKDQLNQSPGTTNWENETQASFRCLNAAQEGSVQYLTETWDHLRSSRIVGARSQQTTQHIQKICALWVSQNSSRCQYLGSRNLGWGSVLEQKTCLTESAPLH